MAATTEETTGSAVLGDTTKPPYDQDLLDGLQRQSKDVRLRANATFMHYVSARIK